MEEKAIKDIFSIKIITEKNLGFIARNDLNYLINKLLDDFKETFAQANLVVDIKFKKGHFYKGKFRSIPLVFVRVRFTTDKGVFFAQKENWGVRAAVHDAMHTIANNIRETLARHTRKQYSIQHGLKAET